MKKTKKYEDFKKFILLDCKAKVERHVFYKGRFKLNPDKKFKNYRVKDRYVLGNIEDRLLYMHDFITEAVNYYDGSKIDKYPVIQILRSYNSERYSGIMGEISGETGSAYNDLNL